LPAGASAASPTPTTNRAPRSAPNECARPQAAVPALQRAMASIRSALRDEVGDPPERQSDTRVNDGERGALHHAQLRIGQVEARPDGIDQNREDETVGVGEDGPERQERDAPPCPARAGVGALVTAIGMTHLEA